MEALETKNATEGTTAADLKVDDVLLKDTEPGLHKELYAMLASQ